MPRTADLASLRSIRWAFTALFLLSDGALSGPVGHIPGESDFVSIASLAQAEIDAGRIPGAVVLIGSKQKILFRRAFGFKMRAPNAVPMTIDTIFDLASVTKVVATTPSVMQLVEKDKLKLDKPVAEYWPEFARNGKDAITVGDLLTHYSGLPADLDLSREWSGYDTAMGMIISTKPVAHAGVRYLYSDVNFEILSELIRRMSGSMLDRYSHEHVFVPLAMIDTGFVPSEELRGRIAPTRDLLGKPHWADVHDATARRMSGVSGHAGLFSTADDLAIYARMLLAGGTESGVRVLAAKSVEDMTTRQSPPDGDRARGYGWDVGGTKGYVAAPTGSYGHLGFTGTMVWILPDPGLYAIVLTNRVYPDGKGDADPLRNGILALLANVPRH